MPVTLQVSKRLRSAYAADCADGVSPIKSSTVMADASFAGGSTSAAQPRQLSSSAQYVKRLKYSPPIACTVRMLLDSKVVQRAGRCRVRFPSFAGWQRQYHKVRIVGRVLSVVQSGHAGGGKQHLYDGSDDDDGNTSSDEDPRQARKKKGRRQGKDRCGGGRERPFTTLVVCDSTGMIEVRVVHPLLMSIPQNEHSLALPSWEAVMSGQHSLLSSSRRRGGGAAELSSSSWQLAIVAGDYVSCTAAIRLRPVFEVSRGEHEQILPSSPITQSAPRSFPFSSTTPYPSSEHYDSPRNNDEAPHSCVSHLIIHAQLFPSPLRRMRVC
ncbi:Hypothetical protein, putative [Bodo saltans]|uniref:Uncharacterized protein n=1 Tax=Bodo saltans TaxID=75058 RepID=A0A0S4IZY9_BODSA|nr:Hypothetical protein, putative [Bodo saltans]|eukprot:CUG05940.1 Hypothetical protein, putative [Bodo saltans]